MTSTAVANSLPVIPQDREQSTAPFKTYSEFGRSMPTYAVFVTMVHIPGSAIQVREPFFVRIEPEGDQYYATSPISLIYEMGGTRKEALQNYLDALVEHFEWLAEQESMLAPTTQEELALLRRHLRA